MGEITNVVALSRKLRDNYPIVRIVETRQWHVSTVRRCLYGTSLIQRSVVICGNSHFSSLRRCLICNSLFCDILLMNE